MHSSRMRTAHSISRHGGGVSTPPLDQAPPGPGTTRDQTPPRADPPAPGMPPRDQTPLDQAPPWDQSPLDQAPPLGADPTQGPDTPPVNRITDMCKNITLPQLHCGQ